MKKSLFLILLIAFISVIQPCHVYAAKIAMVGDNTIKSFAEDQGNTVDILGIDDLADPNIFHPFDPFDFTGYNALIVTRNGTSFGTDLGIATSNVIRFVQDPNSYNLSITYGPANVVLFAGDWADMVSSTSASAPDGSDSNVQSILQNALIQVTSTNHGYFGEFNGTAIAMTSNSNGFQPLGLLPGNAGVIGLSSRDDSLTQVQATGNDPLGLGISDFSPCESMPGCIPSGVPNVFLTKISGADPSNVNANFIGSGIFPAVLSSSVTPVPEVPAGIVPLILLALSGLAFRLKGFLLGKKGLK